MSLAEAWDRMFWSIMIVIFVGLFWMKFLQDYATCEGTGFIVALLVGGTFFYTGYRQARRNAAADQEEERLAVTDSSKERA